MDSMMYNSINTDRELAVILGRFSDDTIDNAIVEALRYKYRPFDNRMPNLPESIAQQFNALRMHSSIDIEQINMREREIYITIIQKICSAYNLELSEPDIPADKLYPLAYTMYEIFVSEFTIRMLQFFSTYISLNKEVLLNAIPDEKRIDRKTNYTKKMFVDPVVVSVYENMESIIDIIAGLDFSFFNLLDQLAGRPIAEFISSYISDIGDLYKNHYAVYIYGQVTRTDMITSIKLRFLNAAGIQLAMDQPPVSE